MNNFITNATGKDLKRRIVELSEASNELKFLVGFFYFSGIRELYKGLKQNQDVVLKVLVGLNVDQSINGLIEYAEDESESTNEEKTQKYMADIRKSLASDEFDNEEAYEQIRFFVQLIRDNRLIIRKTDEPNHAKLYYFKLNEHQVGRTEMFISGSSNLTRYGLTTQAEFNVELSDYGTHDAEEYFDYWWENAVKITEKDEIKQKLIDTIVQDTHIKDVSPFEAFVLTLKTYLDSFEQKDLKYNLIPLLEENGYKTYAYQLDAVRQALSIIEKNNGVIIADVVGLGKTIIACAVANQLGERGIVICPPGLIGDKNKTEGWLKYLEQFDLAQWEVRSSGDLEATAEFVNSTKNIGVVIIDEAHRFRNQDTQDYEFLSNICRDRKVILLSATPFNNKPGDILSLLKLFITPKKSTITLESNLTAMFRTFRFAFDRLGYISKYWNSKDTEKKDKARANYLVIFGEEVINLTKVKERSKFLAAQIRHVIEPVTIRRNRLDLQNNPLYKDEVKDLSKIADPEEWFYELSPEQSRFYDQIISEYFGSPDNGGRFKGAIYRPFIYESVSTGELSEKENFELLQQQNLYEFMRRLMVKRFESSFGSFAQSIKNMLRVTEHVLEFIEKTGKYILDRGLLEKIYADDLDEIETALLEFDERLHRGDFPKNNKIYHVNSFKRRVDFLADIRSDLHLYEEILKELSAVNLVEQDPKQKCLIVKLREFMAVPPEFDEPKRKIIIFSEYLDTVKYLEVELRKEFGDRILVAGGTLSTSELKRINQDFDATHKNPTDHYDVLLATDRLSEGFNLNRAGMIINYDIPWNPVRVIQRVGRINRISKKVFNLLYIINFFPSEKAADIIKMREIARAKMFMIHQVLGEDAKIFDIDETPTAAGLYAHFKQNPDELEGESFYTKALNRFLEIKKSEPELVEKIGLFPPRVKTAKPGDTDELFVFFKKGRLYIQGIRYQADEGSEPYQTSFEEIFINIECSKNAPHLTFSPQFWKQYENLKTIKESDDGHQSERALEPRAFNNLKALLKQPWESLSPYRDFLKVLLVDIKEYGTLSDYTLRRIGNLKTSRGENQETIDTIAELQAELGPAYMTDTVQRRSNQKKEIIIAIENRKL